MDLLKAQQRIDRYLSSEKVAPIIVDFPSKKMLLEIIDHYSTGKYDIVPASQYCAVDGELKIEEFFNAISSLTRPSFITGLSTLLKVMGEDTIAQSLKAIMSKAGTEHVVILTYQSKRYLNFSNPKYKESGRIVIVDGEKDVFPSVSIISPELACAFSNSYPGIEHIAKAVEFDAGDQVYIASQKTKADFPDCTFPLTQMRNGYDIICLRDGRTIAIANEFGTAQQWNKALEIMGDNGNWNDVAERVFGSPFSSINFLQGYIEFDDTKRWLLYILFLLFDVNGHPYLSKVLSGCTNYKEFLRACFRTLLTVDRKDPAFSTLYSDRKVILSMLQGATYEIIDYCKVVSVKEKEAIYYLTDLTQPERECIIEYLDKYGISYSREELRKMLLPVFPDLAMYLYPFRFKDDLLNQYFDLYNYQKVINKILPSFELLVEEQAIKRDFYTVLRPRTLQMEEMDVSDSQAYFIDALGVEYLGYIQEKCKQYGLSIDILLGRAELPTLTCFNKDFVEFFASKGCHLSDVKELDEIKHHGEDNFDYEKVKTPIYLIRELQVIDEVLQKIKTNLTIGNYQKGILVSDHGASRLAVLHETETIWLMQSSGEHSGRCCPKNEINDQPACAIESEGYWVLANYDRFKGGRKSNVEVHGGASLEEVAVPIVEITMKQTDIEAFILDDYRVITIGPNEHAKIKIYVGTKSKHVSVMIKDKEYACTPTENAYVYEADLSDITRKGSYDFSIYIGYDIIAANQQFTIQKKGMSENKMF